MKTKMSSTDMMRVLSAFHPDAKENAKKFMASASGNAEKNAEEVIKIVSEPGGPVDLLLKAAKKPLETIVIGVTEPANHVHGNSDSIVEGR
jgi:succinyl-CoA synthetase alpha subunit